MQLEDLIIDKGNGSPQVSFSAHGRLDISGNSFPEDAIQFYRPIISWLERYIDSEQLRENRQMTHLTSKVTYFNTGSRPFILTIIKELNELAHKGYPVRISWYYEDDMDDMEDHDDINFKELIHDFVIDVDFIPIY